MGFCGWKKIIFFQNACPIVGAFIVSAFFDLVGFIGFGFFMIE
ncbi:putative membrane protein [Helicobacter pylori Hp H-10]|nr:putative membrane protein [Helicobacter pylori Hp H-10]